MFDNYIRKILPIPILAIQASKDGYKYLVTTHSSVINEHGTEDRIIRRLSGNKRVKSISYWRINPDNDYEKQAVIEFVRA